MLLNVTSTLQCYDTTRSSFVHVDKQIDTYMMGKKEAFRDKGLILTVVCLMTLLTRRRATLTQNVSNFLLDRKNKRRRYKTDPTFAISGEYILR